MPLDLSGKWGAVCFNTRFPLPTLLCARYSVKLKLKIIKPVSRFESYKEWSRYLPVPIHNKYLL